MRNISSNLHSKSRDKRPEKGEKVALAIRAALGAISGSAKEKKEKREKANDSGKVETYRRRFMGFYCSVEARESLSSSGSALSMLGELSALQMELNDERGA
jgi:hypothetical protein